MSPTRSRATILVVDDEPRLRDDLCRILRSDGHFAIPAGRGPEAHWCVERQGDRVDLLVAGLAGPEADDYHLGIPIGRLFPRTPALFISAIAREEHIRSGLLHPGTPFLRLPFTPRALIRKVWQLLEQARRSRLM